MNNAGGGFHAAFLDVSPKGQTALVNENFTQVTSFIRGTVPLMTDGGSIVNITSIEGHRAGPGFGVYSAMKAAVENLSKTLALELSDRRIRVNCVAPDMIPTPGRRRPVPVLAGAGRRHRRDGHTRSRGPIGGTTWDCRGVGAVPGIGPQPVRDRHDHPPRRRNVRGVGLEAFGRRRRWSNLAALTRPVVSGCTSRGGRSGFVESCPMRDPGRPGRLRPGVTAGGAGRVDAEERSDLIGRVATGDQVAFAALYDDLAPSVFGLILRVLRDRAQSEEVLQEVMVEVWRTAARFEPARGTVTAWVATMAHRRAVDRVRSEQASRDRVERDAALEASVPGSVEDEVVDEIADRQDTERVRAAMASLTPMQRESVELAFLGGRTHAEVAEILDVPLGTVKTRIRDGLIRLRDTLGAQHG